MSLVQKSSVEIGIWGFLYALVAFTSMTLSTAVAAPDPAPTQFAFIVPAHTSITFQQPAQISVTFMPAVAGQATCRRLALGDQKDPSAKVEIWFDQGTPPSTILVWKGATLQSLPCVIAGQAAPVATLYITGTTLPALVPTAAIVHMSHS